ncbi:MAG: energy transducer TonB [Bryobacteraceae bacterium]
MADQQRHPDDFTSPDRHLDRMLAVEESSPFFLVSLYRNLRDLINPVKLPPLELTSRPLNVSQREEPSMVVSLYRNVMDLINPPKLPPLELTSRPADAHGLITETEETPVLVSLFRNIKDLINPPKLPPLEVTSKPVAVRDIWASDGRKYGRAGLGSILFHVLGLILLLTLASSKVVQNAMKPPSTAVFIPDLAPYEPKMATKKQTMGGGGGGGDRSPLPAAKGKLPKMAPKQFTPPMQVQLNPDPKLTMEPTIIGPPDVKLPNVNMAQYGDPFAKVGPPSNGTGTGGGIGSGSGGGVGSGRGGGFGPGEGGGFGGGVYRIGGGVSAPVPIFKVEPEYSEEARKAKFQGTVLLSIVVDETGKTRDIKVLRTLGLGLDEKAIEAVMKWRFRPAYKDGKPVPVAANVEVNFRLL